MIWPTAVVGLTVLFGLLGVPPGSAAVSTNAVEADPVLTSPGDLSHQQRFIEFFANPTAGRQVRITITPVVPLITIVFPTNSFFPCTPDGPKWNWTCTETNATVRATWMFRIESDTSVPDGLVLTGTITDDVAGLTASAPITFAAQSFVDPTFFAPARVPGRPERQDLSINLQNNGPDDASSVAVTVSGLQDYPTLSLPDGCQRSGGTIGCAVGPILRNYTQDLVIPLGDRDATLQITVTAAAQPNEWGGAPRTVSGQIALTAAPPPSPPATTGPPVGSGPPNNPPAPAAPGAGSGLGGRGPGAVAAGAQTGDAGPASPETSSPGAPGAITPGTEGSRTNASDSAPAPARTGGWWPMALGGLAILAGAVAAAAVVRRRRQAGRADPAP
jgi:hypothetical protein